jgi:hypothetical protein
MAETLLDTREPISLDETLRLKNEYIRRLEVAADMLLGIDKESVIEIAGTMSLSFNAPDGIELAISAKDGTSRNASTMYNDGQRHEHSWDPPIRFDQANPLRVNRIDSQIRPQGIIVSFSSKEIAGWYSIYTTSELPTEYDIRPVVEEG